MHRRRYERLRRAQGLPVPAVAAFPTKAFAALRRFVSREGRTRMPLEHIEDDFPLGRWVARRRADGKRGRLTTDVRQRLEAIPGWSWNPYEEDFQHGLELLRRYAKREGHARVPGAHREGSFRLGIWVEARRTDRRLGRLAPARAKALEVVPGWSWSVRPFLRRRRLERVLTALQQFADREGHTSVPVQHRESGVALGKYLQQWRTAWRKGELNARLARTLQSLPGWAWDTYEEAFRRGLERLERYVAREGHARVPVALVEDGFKLGAWTAFKRRDYRDGRLPRYQVRAFQALPGWAWNISGTRSRRPKVRGR